MTSFRKAIVLGILVLFFGAGPVWAHKVSIFAWTEGQRVFTESKFSGGKRVKSGEVAVFDSQGRELLTGRTNDVGEFVFTAPVVEDLKIVLTAGMGHQGSWTVRAAELGGASETGIETPADPPLAQSASQVVTGLDAEAVEAIVARQLEEKLRPIHRMLAARQEKGPSAGEIVGGIGYIIGLVGLGAYLRYRRDRSRS